MTNLTSARRAHGEEAIYFDAAKKRYYGAVSVGYAAGRRVRRKVSGKTKQDVRAKLHNCLVRAIRHTEAGDLVRRNVAALVRPPAGRSGRPSKSLTVEQAKALMNASAGRLTTDGSAPEHPVPCRLHGYVVLLTTGLRPEEARALRWERIDLEAGTVAVWRSDRAGGDTKTAKSRRTLKLPQAAAKQRGRAYLAPQNVHSA